MKSSPVRDSAGYEDLRALTLLEALERAAQHPKGLYGVEGAQRPYLSWGELWREACCIGAQLQASGLRPGDRVGLILPEPLEFAQAYFGILLAGCVVVPIWPPASMQQLGGYFESARAVVKASGAAAVVTTGWLKRLSLPISSGLPGALGRVFDLASLKVPGAVLRPVPIRSESLAMLQFTSGSTQAPRGVQLTHRNLMENIHIIRHLGVRLEPESQAVSWLPLYHDMGLIGFLLTPVVHRIDVTLMSPAQFILDPLSWLKLMHERKATITFGPNFAYAYTARKVKPKQVEGLTLSQWKTAGCGAEPIEQGTLLKFAQLLAPTGFKSSAFLPCYGLAEFTLAATFAPWGQGLKVDRVDREALLEARRAVPVRMTPELDAAGALGGESVSPAVLELVSCGEVIPGHTLEVVDDSFQVLPERQVGQIRLKGPSKSAGYFPGPDGPPPGYEKTFREGWLYTGDLGYLADGCLYVCGRQRDVIKSRGRIYHPQDVEHAASQAEGVRPGCVVAFGAWEEGTERLVVALEVRPEHRGSAGLRGQVVRLVGDGLSALVDDVMLLRPGSLPRTTSGKVKRGAVQDAYLQVRSALSAEAASRPGALRPGPEARDEALERVLKGQQPGLMQAASTWVRAGWQQLWQSRDV